MKYFYRNIALLLCFVFLQTLLVAESSGNFDALQENVINVLPPSLEDDLAVTVIDTAVEIDVLANDSGVGLSIDSFTQPENGSVSEGENGGLVYLPNVGFTGPDTFTYTVIDEELELGTATVSVLVESATIMANEDIVQTGIDTPIEIAVLANDLGDGISIASVNQPDFGSVTVNLDGTVLYEPAAGFTGSETFVYTIIGLDGATSSSSIIVEVIAPIVPIFAENDVASTVANTPVELDVLANDLGNGISILEFTQPEDGTITLGEGVLLFTPNENFVGETSFFYTIQDENNNTITATVIITVAGESADLMANEDIVQTIVNTEIEIFVLSNDTGNGISIASVSQPDLGSITVTLDGTVLYQPAPGFTGSESFPYTIIDLDGETASSTIIVEVVDGIVEELAAVDDEATVMANSSIEIDVLANDSGDTITISEFTQSENGLVLEGEGGVLIFTPNMDFEGEATFSYTIIDASNTTATATVTITVTEETSAQELILADDEGTSNGEAITIDVLANDSGDDLEVTGFTQPDGGVVSLSGSVLLLTPNEGFVGTLEFTYTVTDASGTEANATVTVLVENEVVEELAANEDIVQTIVNTEIEIFVLSNDTGNGISIASVSQPDFGSITVTLDGSVLYQPAPDFTGSESFPYTIIDLDGATASSTIIVEVTDGIVEELAAVDDEVTVEANSSIEIDVLSNDSGDTITISEFTQSENGLVLEGEGGVLIFTPNMDFEGEATFSYTIIDASNTTATATVTITVTEETSAQELILADDEGTSNGEAITIDVLANDSGDDLEVTGFTQPDGGVVSLSGSVLLLTPNEGFVGTLEFTYTVTDASGTEANATVTVLVENEVVEELAANEDIVQTIVNTEIEIFVLSNDTGNGISIASVSQPDFGSITVTLDGSVLYQPAPDFTGSESFAYTIIDADGATASSTIIVEVIDDNVGGDLEAVDDEVDAVINIALEIDVLANDIGESITITDFTQSTNGSVALGTGVLVFAPNLDFIGEATFTYTITDASNNSSTATVTVNVDNDNPNTTLTLVDDEASTEGDAVLVDVLLNDTGDGLQISSFTQPEGGTVTFSNGQLLVTPNAGFTGIIEFTYTALDTNGDTAEALVTITVGTIVPVDVVANEDIVQTTVNVGVIIDALVNDTGTNISISSVAQPSQGSVTISSDGTLFYEPATDFVGSETFAYTIIDLSGQTSTSSVIVEVIMGSSPDIEAVDDEVSIVMNTLVEVTVLTNDIGDGISITSFSQPENGSVGIGDTGVLVFTPNTDFVGITTFMYTILDADGNVDMATVTITVLADSVFMAIDDAQSTDVDTPILVDVLANDLGDNIQLANFTQPIGGVVSLSNNQLLVTPSNGFVGVLEFNYTITDGSGNTSTATVLIAVGDIVEDLNAVDDVASTAFNTPATINVLNNDNGQGLFVTSFTQPQNGSVSLGSGNTLIFVPEEGFTGVVSFEYTISDINGDTDTATVTLTVFAPSGLLMAVDDQISTVLNTPINIDVMSNDTGAGISIDTYSEPASGTLVLETDGTFTFTPADGFTGTVNFDYSIIDEDGEIDFAVVTIIVSELDDFLAIDDEVSIITGESLEIDVLANDLGEGIVLSSFSQPSNGGVISLGEDNTLIYTPTEGFVGIVVIQYTITNSNGDSDSAILTITVLSDEGPDGVDDFYTTAIDTELTINPLDNDTGTEISIQSVGQPFTGGTTVLNEDGTITFIPNSGFLGLTSFQYTVIDILGQTDVANVTVSVVDAVNEPPCSQTLYFCTAPVVPISICFENCDPEGNNVSITSAETTFNCSIFVNSDLCLTYTPLPAFVGADSLTVVICDDQNPQACSESYVFVTVGETDPPQAIGDAAFTAWNENVTIEVLGNDIGDNLQLFGFQDPDVGTAVQISDAILYEPEEGFIGNVFFEYIIVDACNNLDTAGVLIDVSEPINAGPLAVDDNISTLVNTPVEIDVLGNDSGDGIFILEFEQPENGTVTEDNGVLVFTPEEGFIGTVTFTYTITDADGNTDTATVTIVVEDDEPNLVLVAEPDAIQTPYETAIEIDVLANDIGSGIMITTFTDPINGTVAFNDDGTALIYTPNPGFSGTDFFFYTIQDEFGNTETTVVSIVVLPEGLENQPPIAGNDMFEVNTYDPIELPVLSNDSDPENGMLTITEVIGPEEGGTVEISEDGNSLIFTADSGFVGTVTFTYIVCDDGEPQLCDTATVSVAVGGVPPTNTAPNAQDDFITANIGETGIIINVCDNDSDPDGDDLIVTVIAPPTLGTFEQDESDPTGCTFIYNSGENVEEGDVDVFVYLLCDNGNPALCDTAYVGITMLGEPIVEINAEEDVVQTPFETPILIEVLQNDQGNNITITDFTQALNGVVELNQDGTALIYTPNPGYEGSDFFTYTITDADGNTDTAIVTITVLAEDLENQPPFAANDIFILDNYEPIELDVLANDSDPENGLLTITEVMGPEEGGTVEISENGTLIFTPEEGFVGTVTFTYIVCDDGVPALCDTATVEIALGGAENSNNPPLAVDDMVDIQASDTNISINVCDNDSDPDGDNLSVTVLTIPTLGSVEVDPTDETGCTLIYTPGEEMEEGDMDVIAYLLCDDGTPSLCDTAVVAITVLPLPSQGLDAQPDVVQTPFETPIEIDVLGNDIGVDISIISFTQPLNGSVSFNSDSTALIYTPAPDFEGEDFFFYTIEDGLGNTDSTAVSIIVLPDGLPNLPPLANNDVYEVGNTDPVTLDVLNNDSDPENGDLIITSINGDIIGGTIEFNADSTALIFTPDPDFVGLIVFEYEVCDNANPALCDVATVEIAVGGVPNSNSHPIANDDIVEMQGEDEFIIINVCDNDFDPDGDNLSVVIIGPPSLGEATADLTDSTGCTIIYTPTTPGELDVFIYMLCDDSEVQLCDTAVVTINIDLTGVLVNPEPDVVQTPYETPIEIDVLANDIGENISITGFTPPDNGTVTFGPGNNTLIYTPDSNFVGTDYFFYEICNPDNECATTLVGVTVLPENAENQPPIANNDQATTEQGVEVLIPILANDSDPENGVLSITSFTEPNIGTVSYNEDSTALIYTPPADTTGFEAMFDYVICDDGEPILCDTATVVVAVGMELSNNPPIAVDDEAETLENTSIFIDLCANDSESDPGETLTIQIISPAANGTVEIADSTFADGCLVEYTPNEDFIGSDYFIYILCDDGMPSLCDTAYVSINVVEQPVEPDLVEAVPDIFYTSIDTPITMDVLGNDIGDGIFITWYTDPENGMVEFGPTGDNLIYTPDSGFVGTDYFEYAICDIFANCDTTLVAITILPDSITNLAPVGVNDVFCNDEVLEVDLDVLANDLEPFGGDSLFISNITDASFGVATFSDDSTQIHYIPLPGTQECDQFDYVLCDNGNPALCDTATVVICMADCDLLNNPPMAEDDQATTDSNTPISIPVLDNDSDPNGDNIIITDYTLPNHGQLTIDSTGGFSYIPDIGFVGTDYFIYIICDDGTPSLCDTAYVTIVVDSAAVDTSLLAIDDFVSTDSGIEVIIPMLDNDVFNDLTLIEIIEDPLHGTAIIQEDSTILYTPDFGFEGIDSLQYVICENVICDTAWIFINVSTPVDTTVDCNNLVIGNGFSPNNDGVNDFFLIPGIENCYPNNELIIFNRWGSEVFRETGYNSLTPWNGTYNGEELPDGTYFYVLRLSTGNIEDDMVGFIELHR